MARNLKCSTLQGSITYSEKNKNFDVLEREEMIEKLKKIGEDEDNLAAYAGSQNIWFGCKTIRSEIGDKKVKINVLWLIRTLNMKSYIL